MLQSSSATRGVGSRLRSRQEVATPRNGSRGRMTVSVRKSARFTWSRRWALYIIGVGLWLSGGLWLIFHYFFVEQGEFGPKIHPLEPWWLKLHGAFGFAAIWIFGLLWGAHVSRAWPGLRRRWSGGVMTGVFASLILSGYLLYYVGNDSARSVVSVLHWGIGVASPICFGVHRLGYRKHRAMPSSRLLNRPGQLVQPTSSESPGEKVGSPE